MKKIAILSIAAFALSFASCKKDRTCTCTANTGAPGAQDFTYTVTYKKATKSQGKAACISQKITPDGQTDTETYNCTLK
jgi:hypothetical protein